MADVRVVTAGLPGSIPAEEPGSPSGGTSPPEGMSSAAAGVTESYLK